MRSLPFSEEGSCSLPPPPRPSLSSPPPPPPAQPSGGREVLQVSQGKRVQRSTERPIPPELSAQPEWHARRGRQVRCTSPPSSIRHADRVRVHKVAWQTEEQALATQHSASCSRRLFSRVRSLVSGPLISSLAVVCLLIARVCLLGGCNALVGPRRRRRRSERLQCPVCTT